VWADLQLPAGAGEDQAEPDEPVRPGEEHLDTRQVPQGHALGGLVPCGQAAGKNRQVPKLLTTYSLAETKTGVFLCFSLH
jgi:hypothetical protein